MGVEVREAAIGVALTPNEYERLAAFRFALRRFLAFSAAAAQDAGLTPTQHQALLTIKGYKGDGLTTIGQLAEHLVVAPHTAAELVVRLEEDGLVEKVPDARDRRRVGLRLTPAAERVLRRLTGIHLQEVRVMAPGLIETLEGLLPDSSALSPDLVPSPSVRNQ